MSERAKRSKQAATLRFMAGAAFSSLWLAGCSGAGSAGAPGPSVPGPAPPTVVQPPPAASGNASDFRTTEYNQSWALDAVHAADAYARGYAGKGVKIGIIDFNFDLASTDLRYDPASRGPHAGFKAMYEAEFGTGHHDDPHGAAVAAVAAALKNDGGIHGVAFDATVVAVDYFSAVNQRELRPGDPPTFPTGIPAGTATYHISDPWTYLVQNGARIINTSWGFDEEDALGSAGGAAAGISTMAVPTAPHERYRLETPAYAIAKGALLIASAGNDGDPDPALSNLYLLDDLAAGNVMGNGAGGAFIIAGATDSSGQIASFSDRAGTAAQYYMVAPGDQIVGPWGTALSVISGTSFSAPMISGAAAIIMQRWPGLTASAVANILFASATDLGAPGVDNIYGHGLLNVDAALQPLGGGTLLMANGTAAPIAQTALVLGPAFGDGGSLRMTLRDASMRDGFGRDFSIDLSGAVAIRGTASLQTLLQDSANWHATALAVGAATQLQLQMHDDPQQHVFALTGAGGVQSDPEPRTLVRLMGEADGFSWVAGNATALAAALTPASSLSGARSLTRGTSPILEMPARYAAMAMPLSDTTDIAFGFAALETGDNLGSPMRETAAHMAGVSLTRHEQASSVSFQLLGLSEQGSVLGSYFGGGLQLADHAATVALATRAEIAVAPRWTLFGDAGLATTNASTAGGSLVTAIDPILSSSFRLGFVRGQVFAPGDTLSFSVAQPQRVERADATLALEGMRDPVTGEVPFSTRHANLAPSGREVAFESAYATALGGWSMQMNLAYRLDAGHIAGRNDVRAALTFNRAF